MRRLTTCANLSKMLFAHYPEYFTSAEAARKMVGAYRGKNGKHNRENMTETSCFVNVLAGEKGNRPKILVFDIETSPIEAYVWGCFKQFISQDQIKEPSHIISFAAKWLGGDMIFIESAEPDQNKSDKRIDDKRICQELWDLVDSAEIVIAHNGQAFDVKTMNTHWLLHGFPPPSPFKCVDTYKMAKSIFRFPINKLDYISEALGHGRKTDHEGFPLWKKCMAGDPEAWETMRKYNMRDVEIQEKVYLDIRAWDKRHPNVSLMYEDDVRRCVVCGSNALKPLAQASYTSVSVFESYRCKNCGKVMRGRKADKKTKEILAHSL